MAQEMDRLEIVIEAQAKSAASELDKLYNSLEKVSGSLNRISSKKALADLGNMAKSAASSVVGGAKQIASRFTLIGSASSKINKATSSLKGLLGAAIGFYGVRSLINLGKQAIELSSDLTEVQNVVEHAFGEVGTKAVEDFTKTSIESFGMSELTAKTIASRYQAMGVSMGITGNMIESANQHVGKSLHELYNGVDNTTTEMSLNLTKLAADMASFYNKSQEDVAQALSTIYTGQTRPLRQFGLDITQATLSEWAMKQGLDADVQSMTQAQKTMLRYQYVLANTAMVQGDFQRTSFTWANQLRMLRQQFEVLGKTIGEVLINVFRPLITWMNKAMAQVISFVETVANALGKIFGWTIIHTPAAGSFEDMSDSFEDVGSAGEDAADGTKAANKALKEYENTVLGFDELNKLNAVPDNTPSSGSGGSGGGGGAGGAGGASGADFQIVKTDNLIEKYKSDIQTLFGLGKYISGVLSDAMESIDWPSIYDKARDFGSGLAEFLNGLISPRLFRDLGITIAGAINTVLNAKDAFLDRFNFSNLGRSFAAGINGFFDTYDFGLKAKTFYKAVNGIVEAFRVAVTDIKWESIGNKISDCIRMSLRGINWENAYAGADKFGEGLAKFMNGLFKPDTFGEVGSAIARSLNTTLRTLSSWASEFKWDSFGRSLSAGLKRFIVDFDWNLAASTFTKLANGILTAIKEAVGNVPWTTLGMKIRTALLNIPWKNLLESVGSAIMTAINAALDFAKGLFDGTPVSDAIEDLKEKINGIAEKIDFPKIASGIQSIVTALSPAISGFAKGLIEVFGKFFEWGVDFLNGIGGAFQAIADAINDLPEGAVEKFGKDLGIVAASIITIKGATKVAGTISAIVGAISKIGGAGASAASGVGQAAAAVEEGAAVVGGAAGATWLSKLGALATSFFTNVGASAAFTKTVEHTFTVSRGDAYLGLINSLGVLNSAGAITNSQFNDMYKYMYSDELKGKDLSEVAFTLGQKLGEMGVTTDALNTSQSKLSGVMDTFNVKGRDQEVILSQLQGGIAGVEAKGFSVSQNGFGGLLSTMLGIGTSAAEADRQSGIMKSGIWAFAAGVAGQAILMAVMGGAFKGIGDKADTSKTLVAGFTENVATAVGNLVELAKPAKDNGEKITEGTGEGMSDETALKAIDTANQTVANRVSGGMKMLMAIKSPSGVMKEIGEYITLGLAEGIKSKAADALNEMTTILTDMKTAVSNEFNNFRSHGAATSEMFKTGLTSVSFSDVPSTWFNTMSFASFNSDMMNAGASAANSFANGMRRVHLPIPHLNFDYWVKDTGNGYNYGYNTSIDWYALGGFPNKGDLFWAGEQGPEMVGKMGNRNVVANNSQITEGIRAAVVDGFMEAFMATSGGSSNNTPYQMNITMVTPDGEVLARQVERGQMRRNSRFNPVAAPV